MNTEESTIEFDPYHKLTNVNNKIQKREKEEVYRQAILENKKMEHMLRFRERYTHNIHGKIIRRREQGEPNKSPLN